MSEIYKFRGPEQSKTGNEHAVKLRSVNRMKLNESDGWWIWGILEESCEGHKIEAGGVSGEKVGAVV